MPVGVVATPSTSSGASRSFQPTRSRCRWRTPSRAVRSSPFGVLLGLDADRAPQPAEMADQDGTRPGHGRLHRPLLQSGPPTQLSRLSHPDRIRSLTLNTYPAGHFVIKSGPLNGVPGHMVGAAGLEPRPQPCESLQAPFGDLGLPRKALFRRQMTCPLVTAKTRCFPLDRARSAHAERPDR
jgi:hypothetical protein